MDSFSFCWLAIGICFGLVIFSLILLASLESVVEKLAEKLKKAGFVRKGKS